MLRNLTEQLSVTIRRATDFLHSKYMRRTLFAFSIMSVMVGLFIFANPVQAQGLTDVANGMINAVSYILIAIAGIFMQITIFALKFFIEIAGYNNYIDASIVKLGWNMVRDVANMFFVVILLVIAFGTILGLEQYEWKKTLAKLIMSAFLVNFSNLICQVIIDVSQVFTITFLNAIAGAAGGNLIKMFNFDEILQIAERGTDPSGIQIELFAGAVMTIVFAGMAMATIGAYLVVIIARMVVLWTLMILSPLAFLFSALPSTQSHAQEFWNQFTHQVIVAPVMVFFLWLAFATFGGGDIVQQDIEQNHPLIADGGIRSVTESTDVNGNSLGVTFSKAASWENMANFAVAIAFLWIGLERVQKLGVVGGGLVSGAMSFGKNVATIASGYALGRWMTGKGVDGLKAGAKGIGSGLYTALAKNRVEIIGNWGKRQVEGWGAFRAAPPPVAMEDKRKDAGELSELTIAAINASKKNEKGETELEDGMLGTNKAGKGIKYDKSRGGWYQLDEKNPDEWAKDYDTKTGRVRKEWARDAEGKLVPTPDTRNPIQKALYNRQMALIQSRKNLEKVKNTAKVRDDLIDKRVTAAPKYLMQALEGDQPDAFDRMEQGMLEAEQMRSAAKTEEFKALGKELVLGNTRFKDGKYQEGETVAAQIAGHKTRAAVNENLVKKVQADARRNYMKDKGQNFVKASIKADLQVKAAEGESKAFEAGALAQITNESAALSEALRARHDRGEITDEELSAEEKKNEENLFIARKIAAEKQEHQLGINAKASEKKEEAAYLEGAHGQAELQQEAVALAATAASEAAIKTLTGDAERSAMQEQPEAFKNKIAAELEAARAEGLKKEEESRLTRQHREGAGADVLKAIEEAKIVTTGEENAQKAQEADVKASLVQDKTNSRVQDALAQTGQATLRSQSKESVFKGAEADAAADAVARDILEAARTGVLGLVDQLNLGEQAKKGADDLVKTLKNELLEKKFKEAKKALSDAAKSGGLGAAKMLAESDTEMGRYVRAMRYSQESLATAADQKKAQDIAEGKADEVFVEMPRGGVSVPTQAAANYAKRKAAEFSQLGDAGRADAGSRTLAHMLLQAKRNGGNIDSRTADDAYSVMLAISQGANIDDFIADIETKLNLLKSTTEAQLQNEYGYSQDQIEGLKELKHFAEELKIVEEGTDGKYQGQSNDVTQAHLAQFFATGGDMDLVRTNNAIDSYMVKEKIEDYDEGIRRYFASGATPPGKYTSQKSFEDAIEEKSDILVDAQEQMKQAGVKSGHFQMVGAIVRDSKTGAVRLGSRKEAIVMRNSEKSKNQDVKIAPHALGTLNTGNGYVSINADDFATSNVSGFNDTLTFKARTQERTVRVLYGGRGTQKGSKNKDGRVVLGGSAEDLKKRGGGDLDTGVLKLINETFLPTLEHSATTISLAAHTDVGHTERFDAQAGVINGQIAGTNIRVDNSAQLIGQIQKMAESFTPVEMKKMDTQIAAAKGQLKKQLIQRKQEMEKLVSVWNTKKDKFKATEAAAKKLLLDRKTKSGGGLTDSDPVPDPTTP